MAVISVTASSYRVLMKQVCDNTSQLSYIEARTEAQRKEPRERALILTLHLNRLRILKERKCFIFLDNTKLEGFGLDSAFKILAPLNYLFSEGKLKDVDEDKMKGWQVSSTARALSGQACRPKAASQNRCEGLTGDSPENPAFGRWRQIIIKASWQVRLTKSVSSGFSSKLGLN